MATKPKISKRKPKAPSKESRKGLIKVVKPVKKELFKFTGELNEGDIASVDVFGYIDDKPQKILDGVVFRGEKLLIKKIRSRSKVKYDCIEAIVVMRWDKYGQRIQ